jgi:hypothetical protein
MHQTLARHWSDISQTPESHLPNMSETEVWQQWLCPNTSQTMVILQQNTMSNRSDQCLTTAPILTGVSLDHDKCVALSYWYLTSLCKWHVSEQLLISIWQVCYWYLTSVWLGTNQCLMGIWPMFGQCLTNDVDVSMTCIDVYWRVNHAYWRVLMCQSHILMCIDVYWRVNDVYWHVLTCQWRVLMCQRSVLTCIDVYWHVLTCQWRVLTCQWCVLACIDMY